MYRPGSQILHAGSHPGFESRNIDRILLKTEGRILIIRKDEIDWLEAKLNYVLLHVRNNSYYVRTSMTRFEQELDPSVFLRMNRSAIANLDFILELKPWLRGNYRVLLKDGVELTMGREYLERLYSMISRPIGIRSQALTCGRSDE